MNSCRLRNHQWVSSTARRVWYSWLSMLKRILVRLVQYPPVLDRVRALIEAGHRMEHGWIRRILEPLPGPILDLPCGTGVYCPHFAPSDYTGIDIDQRFLHYAQKKYPERTFTDMNALSMSFPNDTFARVLVIGFLHHLQEDEVETSLREIHRVLKAGGTFLLIEDCPTRSKWNVLGRLLQSFDDGGMLRPMEWYLPLLEDLFVVERKEPVRSGLWDYSVFVLRKASASQA